MILLNCLTSKTPCIMQESRLCLLCKSRYSYFCAKIRYCGNKGQSEVKFNATVRFSDHDFLKRVECFGDQKSFWVILDEFIMWALVKPEVARVPNQQSISGLVEKSTPLRIVVLLSWWPNIVKIGWKKLTWNTVYSAKTRKFGCRTCTQSTSVFCHKRTQLWKFPQLSVFQSWWK